MRLGGEELAIMTDITEYRLARQLRSASVSATTPRPPEPAAARNSVVLLMWRKVSPSAYLLVDPRTSGRAVIRDTGSYAGRYLWTVLISGDTRPVEGRTQDLERAKSLAEAALLGDM